MIKSKITGFIDLDNGPIEVQGEATADLPLPSEGSVRAFNDEVRKMRKQIKTITLEYPVFPIPYEPTGPVVESTMAEKSEESHAERQ